MSVNEQVKEFHEVFGQPIKEKPEVPDEARVRLRASLIAEEFLETLSAMFYLDGETPDTPGNLFKIIGEKLQGLIERAPVDVNIVELADGLADLDYVVEGTRLEFGIDGGPIADEVHRSNMAKAVSCPDCHGGQVRGWACGTCHAKGRIVKRREDGKILKPESWTAPDIAGVLHKQGWRG